MITKPTESTDEEYLDVSLEQILSHRS